MTKGFSTRRSSANLVALFAAATGLNQILQRRRQQRQDFRVFILEYHELSSGKEREGVVSGERFSRHLECLQRNFRFLSLSDALRYLHGSADLTQDAVVITFDDGCSGNHKHALPILTEIGAPATVFVTTGFVDGEDLWFDLARQTLSSIRRRPDCLERKSRVRLAELIGHWPLSKSLIPEMKCLKYAEPRTRTAIMDILSETSCEIYPALHPMTWDQIRELNSSDIEIGCHTVSHPILSTLPAEQQELEITQSRARIADEIGKPPELFAYPNGSSRDYNAETVRIVQSAGFAAACTTVRGPNRPGCDPYRLKRIGVGADSCSLLQARLSGLFDEQIRRWIS